MILTCLTTLLINITDIPYNKQDMDNFKTAQNTCQRRYKSCLKNFQKRDVGSYRVLCGEKQSFDKKALDNAEMSAIMEEIQHNSVEVQKRLLKQIGR